MKVKSGAIEDYLATLSETPLRLAACTAGLDDACLHSPPDLDDWSLARLLAHLRAAAEVWGESIHAMLAQEQPEIPDVHPNARLKSAGYDKLEFHASLQVYAEQRQALLEALRSLPLEAWSRPATIRGRAHTVFSQVRRMALHEADHWEQIERLCQVE